MLFNSFSFALFFLIVFILFWIPVKKNRLLWQNCVILLSGYIFYGWWDWRFLFLIAITSLSSWGAGILIEKGIKPRLVSAANIILNIGILAVFKYFNFFVESFAGLCSLAGIEFNRTTLNIILPVGISFYTFQALSYSIDVYKGKIEACKDPIRFFAFVSFFPALVAGPIERAQNLLPQFNAPKIHLNYNDAIDGTMRIIYGLFLKIVIADRIAVYVDGAWSNIPSLSTVTSAVAMILFTFQLYLDFYSYSEIAKGTAKLLGFDVMTNFMRPYLSRSFKEFWKRWHISLSSWFMDYVYIPLGGNRKGEARRWMNMMIVFLISGLWHGASWTFVIWGALNGIYLLALDKFMKKESPLNPLIVFTGWCISLILFRAADMAQATGFIESLWNSTGTGLFELGLNKGEFIFTICTLVLFTIWEFFQEKKGSSMKQWFLGTPFALKYSFAVAAILIIILLGRYGIGNESNFIYFQF